MIVGGTAVNIHGYHRLSSNLPKGILYDFDVWYKPTIMNFNKLTDALADIQPDSRKELKSIVFHPKGAFLRITEEPFKIELLPEIKGYARKDYKDVRKNAINFKLENNEAVVISYKDLIRSKEAMARPVDKEDIKKLKKINKNKGMSL